MILLHTNVVSEVMHRSPDPIVLQWLDKQDTTSLLLSAVAEAERRRGVAALPSGKRREKLLHEVDAMIAEEFADRVWPFDSAAAAAFANIFVGRRAKGRPIRFPDCQNAAIVRSRGAALARRNTSEFEGCGVTLLNPLTDH